MGNFLEIYQNIPLHIDPTAISVGPLSLGWYPLMYVAAFLAVYLLLRYRIRKDGIPSGFNLSSSRFEELVLDFLIVAIAGVLIGGRAGYVLFYNLPYYLHNPLAVISPYDFSTGRFIGIYGMSYHGGLIGVILGSWWFLKRNRIDFWQFADFIVPTIPAGYFFGRLGNFLNLELYGRITDSPIGMHFPLWTGAGPLLRYPSQLFEASFEGILLFILLWSMRKKKRFDGQLLALYIIGYGAVRFSVEFFRQPDEQIGFLLEYLTLGQILCMIMILAGIWIYFRRRQAECRNLVIAKPAKA